MSFIKCISKIWQSFRFIDHGAFWPKKSRANPQSLTHFQSLIRGNQLDDMGTGQGQGSTLLFFEKKETNTINLLMN